ncbi:MAG: hypothetical protein GY805_01260 [Chloroflexi bacterium]|nr:hypothetical protein [Chloroflexota bacterium]
MKTKHIMTALLLGSLSLFLLLFSLLSSPHAYAQSRVSNTTLTSLFPTIHQSDANQARQTQALSLPAASTPITWTISYDPPTDHIRTLAVYNDNLYAGGFGPGQNDGRLYQYDGNAWIDINFASAIGVTVDLIESLQVFNNRLYIGVRADVDGNKFVRVYYYDGTTFAIDLSKPGQSGYSGIESFTVYSNTLYTTNSSPVGEVYQRNSDNNWTTLGGTIENGSPVRSLASYNGSLYAGTGGPGDQAKVWRWTGVSWVLAKNLTADFVAAQDHDGVTSLVALNGNLYIGPIGPSSTTPVVVYDGTTWTISTTINNCGHTELDIIADELWVSGCNGQVYRLDGSLWAAMGNIGGEKVIGLAQYGDFVYANTLNSGRIYATVNTIDEMINQPPNLTDGLIAYYPFNGNANDESGNGYHGTIYGATLTTDRLGNSDSAYKFNGNSNAIIVPGNDLKLRFLDGSDISLSAWVFLEGYNSDHTIIVAMESGITVQTRASLRVDSNGYPYYYALPVPKELFGDSPIPLNEWHHIAVGHDGSDAKLYLDGELIAHNPSFGALTAPYLECIGWPDPLPLPFQHKCVSVTIGAWTDFWGVEESVFNGTIDEVRLYQRALSISEIEELFNEESSSFMVMATNPMGNGRIIVPNGIISATFSQDINSSTIFTNTFTVRGQQTGIYSGNYTFGSLQSTEFDATNDFKPGEDIVVTLSDGLQSIDGTGLIPYTWQFWTAVDNGTGFFSDSGQALGNSNSFGVVLGDLDGDNDLDAFVANTVSHANKVWLNDGDGTFSDSGQNLGNSDSYGIVLGDLDDDGDLDAFVGNITSQANKVWLNDGAGIFSDSGQSLGAFYSYGVALGDIDGDGDLDAFTANNAGQANKVWLNDGIGNFGDSGQNLGNSNSTGVMFGDVDGDGDLDAFVVNQNQSNKVWLNDGTGIFSDSDQNLGSANSFSVALGDMDEDGDLDAFVVNSTAGPQANKVYLNDGVGIFSDSGQNLGDSFSQGVALGDVDGDGDLDAFVGTSFDEANEIWLCLTSEKCIEWPLKMSQFVYL